MCTDAGTELDSRPRGREAGSRRRGMTLQRERDDRGCRRVRARVDPDLFEGGAGSLRYVSDVRDRGRARSGERARAPAPWRQTRAARAPRGAAARGHGAGRGRGDNDRVRTTPSFEEFATTVGERP